MRGGDKVSKRGLRSPVGVRVLCTLPPDRGRNLSFMNWRPANAIMNIFFFAHKDLLICLLVVSSYLWFYIFRGLRELPHRILLTISPHNKHFKLPYQIIWGKVALRPCCKKQAYLDTKSLATWPRSMLIFDISLHQSFYILIWTENAVIEFIQPAREARGPEGPARWER